MKKHLAGVASLAAGLCLFAVSAQADYSLSILHINDLHSRILPVNKYDSTCGAEDLTEGKCFGGFARVAQTINDRRSALKAAGKNVLVLDAGDQFQGSLFYTKYKGQAAVELMNMTGFDAMTIGNHEFDDGPGTFLEFLNKAKFPVISANTIASQKSELRGKFPTSIVLDRAGEKIGIIGALAEDTDETSSPGSEISFFDTARAVQPIVDQMEAQGVNKIILLSHLGVPRDKVVASQLTGVDVIVGGHSHTLLSNSDEKAEGPYPVVVNAPDGKAVPIVQAYAYSKFMGELELTFDDAGNVTGWSGDSVLLDSSFPEDAVMKARIAELNEPLAEIQKREVGVASKVIDGDRNSCRSGECEMANLVADAMLARVREKDATVEIALQNGGGVRASIDEGPVTMGEVLSVLPFQNTIATFKLTGEDFITALENGLSKVDEGAGRFPQLAGARYTWDPKAEAGARVVSVEVGNDADGFVPLDPGKVYSMVTNNYVRNGGDGYDVLAEKAIDAYDFGPNLEDALADYITANSPVKASVGGRIMTVE
ncbi:bifunctional metallophosphatase/5'-nucleotidase [Kiloniella laminariae]|uniref:bifunctional metallophosphatase/5'-nucleotidase n=1 Tax=Kiloniella laminariae TaxID=454162 RepID=UPI0003814216|nr:bifunctional metallophosphatase/5'-nucleotidase [Kiloniella laminariae]